MPAPLPSSARPTPSPAEMRSASEQTGTQRQRAAAVTARHRLAAVPLSPVQASRSLVGERVLVVGGGSTGLAIARLFAARAALPEVIAPSAPDEAAAAVERIELAGPVRHLILTTPWAGGDWRSRQDRWIVAAFVACQRWLSRRISAADLAEASLLAITDLGGDFGLSGDVASVEGGALAGLLKGIAREFPSLWVRVVDGEPRASSAEVAATAWSELADRDGPLEVGHRGGRRLSLTAVVEPPPANPAGDLPRAGEVWLVTGGARGVTAACGEGLARRFGARLALVGSTAPVAIDPGWLGLDTAGRKALGGRIMAEARQRGDDPLAARRAVEKSLEITASLARFAAGGIDARYFPCDLADPTAARALVANVRRELGPICGLVHGAGFEAAGSFPTKTVAGLRATLGPKSAGLTNLLESLADEDLRFLVAFGSTSGRLGGFGQADYSLANDLLAKIVDRFRRERPSCRSTVFHWPAWDEVGMATRPESRFALERFGIRFMPVAEGVGHFLAEIEAGLPVPEVLIAEPGRLAALPRQAATGTDAPSANATPQVGRPARVALPLDPMRELFLQDHRRHGRPLLPAALAAELLARAAVEAGLCSTVGGLADFSVERSVTFPTDALRTLEVEIDATSGGSWLAVGRMADEPPPAGDRPHLRARVVPAAEPITAVCTPPPLPFFAHAYRDDRTLWHGPSLRTLTGLFLDRSGGWGRLVATAADAAVGSGRILPVPLLDGCLMACGVYSYVMCGQRVELPAGCARLRLAAAARPDETCSVRFLFHDQDEAGTRYDVVLFGADGRPLLAVDGLRLNLLAAPPSPPRPSDGKP
jgi:NAD(P)-dependent dehydrogenase (short-subunit alcohol dehydrogenase family)